MSKYHSRRVFSDGMYFDSNKEATRWGQLKMMAKAGLICNLVRQVKRELIPAQYIDGKCVERAVNYTSDFEYDEVVPLRQKTVMAEDGAKMVGKHIVEDVKGYKTEVYRLKKKLLLWRYGISIKEV